MRSAAASGPPGTGHHQGAVAQGDEAIDVRDTGGSDQVFHAGGCYLAGLADRRPRPELDRGRPPDLALPSSAASDSARDRLHGSRPTGSCNRYAGAYDTASLRRPPARRSDAGLMRRHPSRTSRPAMPRALRGDRPAPDRASGAGVRLAGSSVAGPTEARWIRPVIWRRYWMKLHRIGALAAVSVLAFAACSNSGSAAPHPQAAAPASGGAVATPGDTSKGTVNIAIELPQQGSELAASQPIINGIQLAIKEAGGAAGGYKIEIPKAVIFDDAKDGAHDPQTGAQNMSNIVGRRQRRRGHRPAQLERRQGPDPDHERGRPAPVLPGQHQRGPDQARVRRPRHPQGEPRRRSTTSASSPRTTTRARRPPSTSSRSWQEERLHHRYTETFGKGIADNFEKYLKPTAARSSRATAPRRAPRTTAPS